MSSSDHHSTKKKTIRYADLQKRLGVQFIRKELLVQALTHRSFLSEDAGASANERLEFLGDAVLDLLIAEALFYQHPDWLEGQLTKARSSAVDTRALDLVARRWRLGNYIRMSRGEEASGGRERRALLADTVEAVIAACFLDQGLEVCREFVLREFALTLAGIDSVEAKRDYKTQLQERCQTRDTPGPTYEILSVEGPDHDRTYQVAACFAGGVLGRGAGKSKKEAEQAAAADALRALASPS